jgi:hypothetical protein
MEENTDMMDVGNESEHMNGNEDGSENGNEDGHEDVSTTISSPQMNKSISPPLPTSLSTSPSSSSSASPTQSPTPTPPSPSADTAVVKVYSLTPEGEWDDMGMGIVRCESSDPLSIPSVVVQGHSPNPSTPLSSTSSSSDIILQSKIRYQDFFERQGDSIIMWRDVGDNSSMSEEKEYALSFRSPVACDMIWEEIARLQGRYMNQSGPLYDYMQGSVQIVDASTGLLLGVAGPNGVSIQEALPEPSLLEMSLDNLDTIQCTLDVAPTSNQREAYADLVLSDDCKFLKKMMDLYDQLEDLDNIESLKKVASIGRNLLLLNSPSLLEEILSESMFIPFVGLMEYDPALKERPKYREFFENHSQPQHVVSLPPEFLNQVRLIFRLRFMRDNLIRPLMDDTCSTAITSMLSFSTSELCKSVFYSDDILSKLFIVILSVLDKDENESASMNTIMNEHSNGNTEIPYRDGASKGFQFLRELFVLSRGMSMESRCSVYQGFTIQYGGTFALAVHHGLTRPESTVEDRYAIAECLMSLVTVQPTDTARLTLSSISELKERYIARLKIWKEKKAMKQVWNDKMNSDNSNELPLSIPESTTQQSTQASTQPQDELQVTTQPDSEVDETYDGVGVGKGEQLQEGISDECCL